jgi:hypothetical protein
MLLEESTRPHDDPPPVYWYQSEADVAAADRRMRELPTLFFW